ncbi:transposase [Methyloversatilis sp. NSM2]|uniref:transposase n=1 Tax=Methyloversatilis sp. NSM2 TaxID=3134135 RepID=UPI00311761AB
MSSYVSREQRVPKDHSLRTLRALDDGIRANMSALFDQRSSHTGRWSIPPEQLLRVLLVQILFTIHSERQLVEQLDYNLLFRWFVGLGIGDAVWERNSSASISTVCLIPTSHASFSAAYCI